MAEIKTNTKGRVKTQIHTWCEFSKKVGDKNKSRFPAKKVVKTSANHQNKSQFPWKQTKSNFDGQTSVFCSPHLFPMSLARTFCASSGPPHFNINSLLWYKLGCHQYAHCVWSARQKIKVQGPSSYFIFQGPPSLQVSLFFSTACWCSPTFVRRLFCFLLLRIPKKKLRRHPAITMEPGRRRHSCVPAANRSYRRSSTRSEASRLDDHDMLAFDEFLGHATHLENCSVTWTFCSLQVWDRHRQCGSEGSKINLKKSDFVWIYQRTKSLIW